MLFRTEGTRNHDTGQLFSRHKVQTVDQCLQLCKTRHCHLEQHTDHKHDQNNSKRDDPAHRHIRLDHLEHTANSQNRGIKYETEAHRQQHLNLLNIVCASCDQGSG